MPWMRFTVKKCIESEYATNWQLSLKKQACDLVWFCSARGDNFWHRIKSPWRKVRKSPCKILMMNVSKCKLAQVAPPWSRTIRNKGARSTALRGSQISRIPWMSLQNECLHHLFGCAVMFTLQGNCLFTNLTCNICFFVPWHKETMCRSGTKGPSQN